MANVFDDISLLVLEAQKNDQIFSEIEQRTSVIAHEKIKNAVDQYHSVTWESKPLDSPVTVEIPLTEWEAYQKSYKSRYLTITWKLPPKLKNFDASFQQECGFGVGEKEAILARRLKEYCDPFGKERESTLSKSANIVLDMGKLYLDHATTSHGIEQKISFLKAAGLIVAAQVRFEKIGDKSQVDMAAAWMSKLHSRLRNAAGVSGCTTDVNLSEFVKQMKEDIKSYREQERLADIVQINDDDNKIDDVQKELCKIDQVRTICERNTKCFIDLMARVADKCQFVLGKAPCKFAIFGLGSLARKEVTLYSDFEHAFLLEDKIEENPLYSSIKEYFRWFTVLFHVVVIQFGETVLPSLDIKSLCQENSSKCWFFDSYTPCGVSFDGMMPHACKIPLGIPRKTASSADYVVELIQPVGCMVKFLTKEESIKDGYFLNEVLSRTCFVFGDEDVYDDFATRSRRIIDSEDLEASAHRLVKCILLNPTDTISGKSHELYFERTSSKVTLYRPITSLLAYLSRLCQIYFQSSFEIVDDMKKRQVIDDETHHTLAYTLAVAIEENLKAYQEAGNQRKKVSPQEWADYVGVKSWIDCNVLVTVLAQSVRKMPPTKCLKLALPSRDSAPWRERVSLQMYRLGDNIDSMKSALELLSSTLSKCSKKEVDILDGAVVIHFLLATLIRCYERHYFNHLSTNKLLPISESYLHEWEWCCKKMTQAKLFECADAPAHRSLFLMNYWQRNYKKGLEHYEKWQQLNLVGSGDLAMWSYEMEMRLHVMTPQDLLMYIEHSLANDVSFLHRSVLAIFRCHAWTKLGRKQKVRRELFNIMKELKCNAKKVTKDEYECLFDMLNRLQREHNLYSQSVVASQSMSDFAVNVDSEVGITTDNQERRENLRMVEFVIANRSDPQKVIQFIEEADSQSPEDQEVLAGFYSLPLSVCSSYKEMMKSSITLIAHCKEKTATRAFLLPYVHAMMVLFEKVKRTHVAKVARCYHEAPGNVKYHRSVQPFIYGFVIDLQTFEGIKDIVQQHAKITMALFGCGTNGRQCKVYKQALSYFSSLENERCVHLLWKLLHFPVKNNLVCFASMELFMIATITALVIQKRKSSPKYFSRTFELSRKQYEWATVIWANACATFVRTNIMNVFRYLYDDDRLTPVYNLAVDCIGVDMRKCSLLLWKIFCAPNCSAYIKSVVVARLIEVVECRIVMQRNPVADIEEREMLV